MVYIHGMLKNILTGPHKGDINIVLAEKYFVLILSCMLCLISLVFPFTAKPGILHDKKNNAIGLCEIHVADIGILLYSDFYSILEKTIKSRCLVLIHQTVEESGAGYANSFSVEQKADHSYPLIVVNGKDKLTASPSTHWQTDLSRLLNREMAVEKWKLDLYLSTKQSREGKTIVNFSVCNMEKIKKFNGSFTLWIAEMQTLGSGLKGWVAIKKLAEKNIENQLPAKTVGCSLPDQFSFPELSKKKYCIISLLYDSNLNVLAVEKEFISM